MKEIASGLFACLLCLCLFWSLGSQSGIDTSSAAEMGEGNWRMIDEAESVTHPDEVESNE